jgi:hypothetical protein
LFGLRHAIIQIASREDEKDPKEIWLAGQDVSMIGEHMLPDLSITFRLFGHKSPSMT